jgi:predicted HTH transcriptional regulator
MIEKSFDDIDASDVEALVRDKHSERRTLEYKAALPSTSERDRHEFPADVSSFANASGGDIVYGIADRRDEEGRATGIPEKVVGLTGVNLGQAIGRLDQMCQSSISPRISGVQVKLVEGLSSGPIVVVRVPSSWAAPHMVNQSGRFYSRNNGGKYQMDVEEIRGSVLRSEALPDRLRGFRSERLAKISADETPYKLAGQHRIALHLGHFGAFDPRRMSTF